MTRFAKAAPGIEGKFERFRYGKGYEKWLRRRCIKKRKDFAVTFAASR